MAITRDETITGETEAYIYDSDCARYYRATVRYMTEAETAAKGYIQEVADTMMVTVGGDTEIEPTPRDGQRYVGRVNGGVVYTYDEAIETTDLTEAPITYTDAEAGRDDDATYDLHPMDPMAQRIN